MDKEKTYKKLKCKFNICRERIEKLKKENKSPRSHFLDVALNLSNGAGLYLHSFEQTSDEIKLKKSAKEIGTLICYLDSMNRWAKFKKAELSHECGFFPYWERYVQPEIYAFLSRRILKQEN